MLKQGFLFFIFLFLLSCGREKDDVSDVLLRYGDHQLTFKEVEDMIPDGLPATDSARLFNRIVESWIKDEVLADFAKERLSDTDAIERRVRDYRNHLIVLEYLTRMRETRQPKIEEQTVKEYYDQHRQDLKLEVPLVKGVFLKTSASAKGREEIKNLISSDVPEDIDHLEQDWLDRALEYNYFRDKWIDWETITMLIPHRFGDPETFLKENDYFETEYGDCAYYLKITDYLPSGEEQPFEFAKTWITEVLTQGELTDFENSLVESLVTKSIKEKKLEVFGYDPEQHVIKEKKSKNEKI